MSDLALQPTPKAPFPVLKREQSTQKRVTGKLREAIMLMIWGNPDGDDLGKPLPYDEAARTANITTRAMRKALEKSHVRQFIRAQREVLRESICAANYSRLAQIRDAADNMPAVNAIKLLEQLDETAPQSAAQRQPGITIVIQGASPQGLPMKDVTNTLNQSIDNPLAIESSKE